MVVRGFATVARVLLLAVMLVVLVPGSGGRAAGAGPALPDDPEAATLPPEVTELGASQAWWSQVQSYIRYDAAPTEGARLIDGLSIVPDWSKAGEGVLDLFGASIAYAGDVNGDGMADVIVGAPSFDSKRGKAYAFYQTRDGLATDPDWVATGELDDDEFGCSVAGAGDVNGDGYSDVIVGANEYPSGDAKGRVYIYLGSEEGLDNSPITPLDGEENDDEFGGAVAGAGDVNGDGYADVIIGAQYKDGDVAADNGRAYVYLGGPNGPSADVVRLLTGEASGDRFGSAVAGAGDVDGDGYADVIVGAVGWDEATAGAGAVYVYYGEARGIDRTRDWDYYGGPYDYLGTAVDGAGDVNGDGYADIIFGAPDFQDDVNPPHEQRGGVWVMHGGENGPRASGWDWFKLGGFLLDRFGASVAGAGDVNGDGYADILIGAPDFGTNDEGRAYLFRGSAGGVVDDFSWSDTGENGDDDFGSDVAGVGDVNGDGYADVAVSAESFASDARTGKAYVYYGAADLPSSDADDWSDKGDTDGDRRNRIAGAGDVNGDGYADVVVGAWLMNGGQGRVYVYLGTSDGLPLLADWDDDGEQANSWFGRWVAGAGDVNGDGYGDVLVGAFGYDDTDADPDNDDAGRSYLYYGAADGMNDTPVVVGTGEAAGDHYGVRAAGAGDVNGDGYADIMVGADLHNAGAGKVYVYYGSADGPSASPDRELAGEAREEFFGHSLASVGDVNGDGYGDIAVGAYGAPGSESGPAYKGEVKIYVGSSTGLGTEDTFTLEGENDFDRFGMSVAGAGDVDGNGYSDLLVGAPMFPTSSDAGRGKVYLWTFSAVGTTLNPTWSAVGLYDDPNEFGHSVAGAGDINGDGFADLLVGAPKGLGGLERGQALVFLGPKSGSSNTADWVMNGEANGDQFGVVVAGGGDVNGDGYADILVAAEEHDSNKGKVYAYFGNDSGGRRVLARQRGTDGMEVQPWGLTGAPDEFQHTMWASNPSGRGSQKVEVEACPPGIAFGDEDCVTAVTPTWADLFGGGIPATQRRISTRVRGLEETTLYRWRSRVLYAPLTVARTGITSPPNPAHGPWWRFLGQGFEADLRTDPCGYGLEVTPPRDTESDYPGERVFYTLRVTNTGTCRDTADVMASPEAWTTDLPPTVGALAPGAGSDVHITVDIPADAAVDDTNLATITFTSQGDGAETASSDLTTRVLGRHVHLPMVLKNWP